MENYYGFNIEKIEEKYEAKYIADIELNGKVLAVFYCSNPNIEKGHKHYIGFYATKIDIFIVDATSVLERTFNGITLPNGKVLISCYNRDFKGETIDGVLYSIDGGDEGSNVWVNGNAPVKKYIIKEGKFVEKSLVD